MAGGTHTGMGIVAITGEGETSDEDVEDAGGLALGGLLEIPIFLFVMLVILGIVHLNDGVTGRVLHGGSDGSDRDGERERGY
jgi:hypothetical protein